MFMRLAREIVLVHKGAMGDFLQTWPSILGLTRELGDRNILWAGREAYTLWTSALGIKDSPSMRLLVDRVYGARSRPKALGDSHIIWFGLRTPPTHSALPGFWFVPILDEEGDIPPRQFCRNNLRSWGLRLEQDWRQAWLNHFASDGTPRRQERVLIFPGGGHPAKCWPLQNYLRIARWLQDLGYNVLFLLGPAEIERGMRIPDFHTVMPQNLQQLQNWIRTSGFVLGNDSGPLHLAGFCQVPGLALFGPTPATQWGPPGIATLSGSAPCRPCTRMGVIHCRDPVCLTSISPERVAEELRHMLPPRTDKTERDYRV
ncbi:MAG: glycosyltransferase family 9 protein [Desulfohalobiaceae bacterium]|nr:glycosyltransferase family 9 protein [Desulfohalobiaceae bacterium]